MSKSWNCTNTLISGFVLFIFGIIGGWFCKDTYHVMDNSYLLNQQLSDSYNINNVISQSSSMPSNANNSFQNWAKSPYMNNLCCIVSTELIFQMCMYYFCIFLCTNTKTPIANLLLLLYSMESKSKILVK